MKLFFCLLMVIVTKFSFAQDSLVGTHVTPADSSVALEPARPKIWSCITNLPDDFLELGKAPFRKKNLPGLFAVTASSAALIWQDQALLDDVQRAGRYIHLDPHTGFKVLFKIKETKIIKTPVNLSTAIYQMGEGGTSMLLAGGLLLYGKISHSSRSLQTASDITETFFSMGVATQVLKRCFGRQSPFIASQPGGKWTPFPSFHAYQNNTSNYDAFPSGHLATIMATVTVVAENYPEKKWIKPLGYLVTGLLGFTMINSEVHWAGDYPLALALGYVSGKITVNRHKRHDRVMTE